MRRFDAKHRCPSILTVAEAAGSPLPSVGRCLRGAIDRRRLAHQGRDRNSPAVLAVEEGLVQNTTILLSDDNSAVLEHVGKMLEKEKEFKVVGAISDGTVVVREYLRLRPDVIILDISMGDVSGIDIAQDLRDSGCRAKIIFLTVHEDSDFLNAGIGAGGSAYVVKSRLNQDLLSAIDAVLSNKLFVSPNLLY
jgi:CheY-like chemotaxis protein